MGIQKSSIISTLVTAVVIAWGSGVAVANAAGNGKVQSKAGTYSGKNYIRVVDPDGIKEVKWYNSSDRNNPNRTAEGTETYSCSGVTDTEISLGSAVSHSHGHDVEYIDCRKTKEVWEVGSYFTNWQDGTQLSEEEDDDDTGLDVTFSDVNLDGYPDMVVADRQLGNLVVTVMYNNGDGTFDKDGGSTYQLYSVNEPVVQERVGVIEPVIQERSELIQSGQFSVKTYLDN